MLFYMRVSTLRKKFLIEDNMYKVENDISIRIKDGRLYLFSFSFSFILFFGSKVKG